MLNFPIVGFHLRRFVFGTRINQLEFHPVMFFQNLDNRLETWVLGIIVAIDKILSGSISLM